MVRSRRESLDLENLWKEGYVDEMWREDEMEECECRSKPQNEILMSALNIATSGARIVPTCPVAVKLQHDLTDEAAWHAALRQHHAVAHTVQVLLQ